MLIVLGVAELVWAVRLVVERLAVARSRFPALTPAGVSVGVGPKEMPATAGLSTA